MTSGEARKRNTKPRLGVRIDIRMNEVIGLVTCDEETDQEAKTVHV